jgi:hypothetical protein
MQTFIENQDNTQSMPHLETCPSCGGSTNRTTYRLDAHASGVIETINNIVNLTVASKDENDLKAEYRAGFVQGKLQGKTIISARDNAWDNAYLTDPGHSFPRQIGPTKDELETAAGFLKTNYEFFYHYVTHTAKGTDTAHSLKRLLFRMLGIYHGATLSRPADLNFSGAWLPDSSYLLTLGYETSQLTFMDVYFLNAYCDLMDVISKSLENKHVVELTYRRSDKCSAFMKRYGDEIILTHNTWSGFLSQTMTQTFAVNGDMWTLNASTPGLIGSSTDFGYNNKGIMFNETTHRLNINKAKADGLWIFWRATLAEQFSRSIDDFFQAISLDNTATYLNGYMVVDANNNETGLVEMSYRGFIFYKQKPGEDYIITTRIVPESPDDTFSKEYDATMVTKDYLMGINFPASIQVRNDLDSTDNRPARHKQFEALLPIVVDVETAKTVITYTDPKNPLSIFGRWDLGYGTTDYPKQIPDGSIDSKVVCTSMVHSFMKLSGVLDTMSSHTGFWMLYGTAHVHGAPFVWSQSSWKWQELRDVPDRLDGMFTLTRLHLR